MKKYIEKLKEGSDLDQKMLEPFRLSDEEKSELYTFFPEGIEDFYFWAEDQNLLRVIQDSGRNFFLDDFIFVNSYIESNNYSSGYKEHIIYLGYLDIPCYYGSKEDLEYFIDKYVIIKKKSKR